MKQIENYRPVVRKLGRKFKEFEIEFNLLSNPEHGDKVFEILKLVYNDLNTFGTVNISIGNSFLIFISKKFQKNFILFAKITKDQSIYTLSIRQSTRQKSEILMFANFFQYFLMKTPKKMTKKKQKQVPYPLVDLEKVVSSDWDFYLRRICPFIDGDNHILKISSLSGIKVEIVSDAVSHLVFVSFFCKKILFFY